MRGPNKFYVDPKDYVPKSTPPICGELRNDGKGKRLPYLRDGRQTTICQDNIRQIERLAGYGLSKAQICHILGVSNNFFSVHKDTHPQLNEAVERGKSKAIGKVSKTAYTMAANGRNFQATSFWLKCQAKWEDGTQTKVTINHPVLGVLNVKELPDDQLIRLLDEAKNILQEHQSKETKFIEGEIVNGDTQDAQTQSPRNDQEALPDHSIGQDG